MGGYISTKRVQEACTEVYDIYMDKLEEYVQN